MEDFKLEKLKTNYRPGETVQYFMESKSQSIELNQYLGKELRLEYTGKIHCTHCDRPTKKSFGQGHCFPCFRSLAQCDMCIMKPETCHYASGTCRDPQWGEDNCMKTHTVYLANSSGLKVGITRGSKPIGRWLDQGAIAAVPLVRVNNRLDAGKVEVALKAHVADKTNWRTMLKGEIPEVDLLEARDRLKQYIPADIPHELSAEAPTEIEYPVLEYPSKIKSYNFDKDPVIEDRLMGIKGQYLIFANAVINIRKFTAYQVSFQ